MHAKLMAALVAGGCLLGLQASAHAQAVSAYPQSWMGPTDQSSPTAQQRTAARRFGLGTHCDGNYDPYSDRCYPDDILIPSHE
jgi:hypothetical protein